MQAILRVIFLSAILKILSEMASGCGTFRSRPSLEDIQGKKNGVGLHNIDKQLEI